MVISVLFGLLIAGPVALRAQPKGERATITGEVVDLWCSLEGGDRSAEKIACATACAKANNTAGLRDQPALTCCWRT